MKNTVILYVDDERANRVVFDLAFRGHFDIRCAACGDEALAILDEGRVAVLLADLRMPGMSGHRLLELARERFPAVIRVVITAYGDLDLILRAVNEGLVARYLVKPWDRVELEQILRWALEAHSVARQGSMLQLRLMQFEHLVSGGSVGAAMLHDLQEPISSMRLKIDRLKQHAGLIRAVLPAFPPGSHDDDLQLAVLELPELLLELQLAADIIFGMVQHLRSLQQPNKAPTA